MIEYLTIEEVIKIHDRVLEKHGGLPGIRDRNSLHSAIDAPKAYVFGEEMYPTVYDKASVYLYHIISNHAFNDANKRTGYTTVLTFLILNKAVQVFDLKDLEDLAVEVAKGNETKERISKFLSTGCLEGVTPCKIP